MCRGGDEANDKAKEAITVCSTQCRFYYPATSPLFILPLRRDGLVLPKTNNPSAARSTPGSHLLCFSPRAAPAILGYGARTAIKDQPVIGGICGICGICGSRAISSRRCHRERAPHEAESTTAPATLMQRLTMHDGAASTSERAPPEGKYLSLPSKCLRCGEIGSDHGCVSIGTSLGGFLGKRPWCCLNQPPLLPSALQPRPHAYCFMLRQIRHPFYGLFFRKMLGAVRATNLASKRRPFVKSSPTRQHPGIKLLGSSP